MKRIFLLSLLVMFAPVSVFAATYYASPSGSASWGDSTNISTPCSLSTAFANATAGDLVYLRGGSYTSASRYDTANAGSGDNDSQRIRFVAYPGETPDITVTTSSTRYGISINHNYWTLDGLTVRGSLGSLTENGVIGGETGSYWKILRCHVIITSASSSDNVCAIMSYGSYCLLQYSELEGDSATARGGILFGNSSYCNKILNNNIHHFAVGIHQKWPNCDASSIGSEIAYNMFMT